MPEPVVIVTCKIGSIIPGGSPALSWEYSITGAADNPDMVINCIRKIMEEIYVRQIKEK